ncbi:TPA: hypothetical protein ACH3X1_002823 [Trebouxia sp. C0004]
MHQTATSMTVQSVEDILLLVSHQWSRMKVIHLTGLYGLDARGLTELAMADLPLLQSLSLSWHLGRFWPKHVGHG